MSNFQINFAYPWLLLLLVPALFLAFFPYFRLAKKFRRTRNRVISLVLHVVVTVMCVCVLSGMTFSFDTENVDNEVMIVADFSYSGASKDDDKIEFVHSIIEESDENYKVGVVTFGYDQVYAAPLDNDTEKVYTQFMDAPLPDRSATDIASALNYARDRLTNPSSAQIVLVSDGVQTDRNALDVIRTLSADGVKVSTAYFESTEQTDEVQIIGVVMPDVNPSVQEEFDVGVTVQSSFAGKAALVWAENNSSPVRTEINLDAGTREYVVKCKLSGGGLRILKFTLELGEGAQDGRSENNVFYSYINIENFNKLLVIERAEGESEALKEVLEKGEKAFEVTVVGINGEDLPSTVDALREYDEVVLNNISNADMPEGFIENLNSYVKDYGGGMYTVGGTKIDEKSGEVVANTYVEDDMAGTLYQEMLPVQAIEFTPPVAVVIIIDKSGSMQDSSSTSGESKMEAAKDGAKAAIRALTARDYCAILTLTDDFTIEQTLTPVTHYESLFRVIDSITANGGTYYTPAIERAGLLLGAAQNVERRHVVLVSDGYPADGTAYTKAVERNYTNFGITFSMVAIGVGDMDTTQFEEVVDGADGRFYNVQDTDKLIDKMREELNVDAIKAVNYEDFVPTIKNYTNVVAGVNPLLIPSLGGFFGTRVKDEQKVSVPLNGKYVPVYAQWAYGEGRVGSFMCDLTGVGWSEKFMADDVGKLLVNNMASALLPTVNIHPQDMDVGFAEDNYTTNISIYTSLKEGEKLQIAISALSSEGEDEGDRIINPEAQDGYSRIRVPITEPGVYKITVNKTDAAGNIIATCFAYRAFSYSKEYDMFYDRTEAKDFMVNLADLGKGDLITGAWQLFGNPVTPIHHKLDPKLAFLISSIVLFLLDIAVRKFKFKWIHELVRERKDRIAEKGAEQQI